MVNWIAGQTDRFRCLVSHDGNIDERTAYLMTEELWFPEWEHGGGAPLWENRTGFAKHDPIDHIEKWKTPTLVVHGGEGLPRGVHPGPRHLHRPPAAGRPVEAPLLPGREPLGAEAAELQAVARDRASAGWTSGLKAARP